MPGSARSRPRNDALNKEITMAQYDVFISYNSKDSKWAEHLAKELKDLGVHVWFDQWELEAGGTWMDALDTAVKEAGSVVALVGPSGLGSWERAELREALTRLM